MNVNAILFDEKNDDYANLNKLYHFYKEIWAETWKELNISSKSQSDDFYRFQKKVGLFTNKMPVGFHGYGLFDFNRAPDCDHTFFQKVGVPIVNDLKKNGLFKVATLEYMAIHPEFRKINNCNLSELLAGYSYQIFRNTDIQAVIAVTRNNRSVNKLSAMYGADIYYQDLPLNNVTVDIMVTEVPKIKNHDNPIHQKTIELWIGQSQPARMNQAA